MGKLQGRSTLHPEIHVQLCLLDKEQVSYMCRIHGCRLSVMFRGGLRKMKMKRLTSSAHARVSAVSAVRLDHGGDARGGFRGIL